MEIQKSPKEYLSSADYSVGVFNFCANYYYSYLINQKTTEENFNNFVLLLIWNGVSDKTLEIKEVYQKEEYMDSLQKIQPIIKKIINDLIDEHLSEDDFYKKIWDSIWLDVLFASDLERICAIVMVVFDSRIPYFNLAAGVKMDKEQYEALSDEIIEPMMKASFILQSKDEQNTEKASQLIAVCRDLPTEDYKLVFVANILDYMDRRLNYVIKRLEKKNKTE